MGRNLLRIQICRRKLEGIVKNFLAKAKAAVADTKQK